MLHRQLDPGPDRDRGDTLIEILVALVIASLTAAALLGALVTALTASGIHRTLSNLDTVLRSNVEEAKYVIELQPPATAWFHDGATVTPTTYNGNSIPFSSPAGYTVVVVGIKYWNSSTGQFDSSYTAPADTTGYQLLTLKAIAPNGVSETLSVGVRSST